MDYRHEVKHIISPGDAAAIRANLSAVATLDPHAKERGSYCIRSLYFDDPLDTAREFNTLKGPKSAQSQTGLYFFVKKRSVFLLLDFPLCLIFSSKTP